MFCKQAKWSGRLLLAVAALCCGVAHGNKPPNILLLVAEDLGPRIGAFGDAVAQTPHIDRLAAAGVRFDHVFSAAGVCAPNRSALMTGRYPQTIGTQHMRTSRLNYEAVPPAGVRAFPELLRRAGYVTANTAKTDYQFGEPSTIWNVNVNDFAAPPDLAVWRRLPADQPFFAMINFLSTHESRLVTEETVAAGPYARYVQALVAQRKRDVAPVTDPKAVVVPPYYPDTDAVRASIAQHYDNVHFMDQQVGQVLAHLLEDDLLDNTIVIWTTDHGDGLPRAKRAVYDSGLHVPLLIRFPDGRRAGQLDSRMISFVDLAPIILGLAGVETPSAMQGHNVLDPQLPPRRYAFAGRDRMDELMDRVRAVRDKRYKYIRNYHTAEPYLRPLVFRDMFPVMVELWRAHEQGQLTAQQQFYFDAPRPVEELYDTQTDPYEVVNLVGDPDYADPLSRLRAAMDNWLQRVGDMSRLAEAVMIEQMWPGGEQPVTAVPEVSERNGQYQLRSTTPGASIMFRILKEHARWQIYSEFSALPQRVRLEAKAVRYGYKDSPVLVFKTSG
ncbi:MAG: sulfatase [Pseudomonadota bacterium]